MFKQQAGRWLLTVCCTPFADELSLWTHDSDGGPPVVLLSSKRIKFCPYCGTPVTWEKDPVTS
jgi:hypothetical protein